ncbi:MAG: hypothetical protein D6714_00400, partial [Bacteroidetes bacterium]
FYKDVTPPGFSLPETRAGQDRETGSLWSAPKANRTIHFFPKNKSNTHKSRRDGTFVAWRDEVQSSSGGAVP